MQLFLDREAHRNEEARQRANAIWNDLEERFAALPLVPLAPVSAVPLVPAAGEKPAPEEERAEIEPIEPAPQEAAAAPHVGDIMEMIQLARDEFVKEHERLAAQRAAFFDEVREEKDREIEEKDNRIRGLEEELQQLRTEFQAERQQHLTEEAKRREQELQERMADSNEMRAQLTDLTHLVQDSRNMIEEQKTASDADKEARRQDEEADMIELKDMIRKLHKDMEVDRRRCETCLASTKRLRLEYATA
jgi:DNA repair exonuclease SbcCD ATPase subunit